MKDEFITRVGVWGQRHYQRKQVIADFIKQNYPPEAIRADFSVRSPFNWT